MLRGDHRGSGAMARAQKQAMRATALRKRRSLDPERLAAQSSLVAANLLSLKEYSGARLIASYCAKDDEVQTKAIIERALDDGKRVAVIVTDVPSKTLDFSEIESYDEDGAGYFDRALAGARRITKVGLALESQRLPNIPTSRHDVPLDIVVTEERVIRPPRRPSWQVEKAFKNRGRRSR